MKKPGQVICIFILIILSGGISRASKLNSVLPVDNQVLVLHFQDGMVIYNWDDTLSGSCNGWDYYHTENWHLCPDKDQYVPFGDPLNAFYAQQLENYLLISEADPNYGAEGKMPVNVYRKSKVWEASYDERMPSMHHWIYLVLPYPLKRDTMYSLKIDEKTNTGEQLKVFNFNEFTMESPSIKISNIGYEAAAVQKTADVYSWMGDGGGRDFSRLNGTPWHLFDIVSGEKAYSGKLEFRLGNREELQLGKDFTGAGVWECDFSEFNIPGKYRLVVEGIGSSPVFPIEENIFEEAFKVSMQGMFYQRMGCSEKPAGNFPFSRRPLFKQGVEPEDFVVYISNKEMVTGENPDNRKWYSADLSGEIVEESWGGWSDAYDNDQRPVNFICVFDILLAYYLNPEAFTDNQLYIPEVNNGIPDIIDEALWQIDWWLRMRDPNGGYLTGLTNIRPPENDNYAGAACGWQGWCVAAGAAMAADCFRLAGNSELEKKYGDAALEAWRWAMEQTDQMLDTGVSGLRGRDLKMTAAAFLYNLTGESRFEEVIYRESEARNQDSKVRNPGNWEQQYASVAYIFTPRKVSYPELRKNMEDNIINQAKTDYLGKTDKSPTRAARWTSTWEGMVQTSNEMSLVAIAHKITENEEEKDLFEKGLYYEAEWTLGRNPLGLVQMTGLGEKSVTQTFAPGRRDGYPGLTPGWTPYMCRDGWNNQDHIVYCEWYTNRNYPDDKEIWPWGEHFWNSRYNVPNSEATPQQTFRQKIVLYGYIYGMNKILPAVSKKY
jgi:endoglucanase